MSQTDREFIASIRDQCIAQLGEAPPGPTNPPGPTGPTGGPGPTPGDYPPLGPEGQTLYLVPGVYQGPVFAVDTYVLVQTTNENTNPGMVYVVSATPAPDPNVYSYAPWADYSSSSGGGAVGPRPDPKIGAVKIIPANTPWYFNFKVVSGVGDNRLIASWKFNPYPK